jgi:hypothetical protein
VGGDRTKLAAIGAKVLDELLAIELNVFDVRVAGSDFIESMVLDTDGAEGTLARDAGDEVTPGVVGAPTEDALEKGVDVVTTEDNADMLFCCTLVSEGCSETVGERTGEFVRSLLINCVRSISFCIIRLASVSAKAAEITVISGIFPRVFHNIGEDTCLTVNSGVGSFFNTCAIRL